MAFAILKAIVVMVARGRARGFAVAGSIKRWNPGEAFQVVGSMSVQDRREGTPVRSPERPRPAIRMTGLTLVSVGVGLIVLSLAADVLDIGGGEGFGYQQLIVLIVGIVLILGGLGVVLQPLFGASGSWSRHDAVDVDQ